MAHPGGGAPAAAPAPRIRPLDHKGIRGASAGAHGVGGGARPKPGDRRRDQAQDGRVDVEAFVRDGYVAVRGAVDPGTVASCRELTWAALARRGIRPDDPGG